MFACVLECLLQFSTMAYTAQSPLFRISLEAVNEKEYVLCLYLQMTVICHTHQDIVGMTAVTKVGF